MSDLRLFAFPCAGAGGAFFSAWRGVLPEGIELVPMTLPGRMERIAEPPVRRFDQAADAFGDALAETADRPYALLGHSLGALLAFATARRLRTLAKPPPLLLIVAASPAPTRVDREEIASQSRASDEELLTTIARQDSEMGRALSLHAELRELVLAAWRDDLDLAASFNYERQPPLDCPILALSGDEDASAPAEAMIAWGEESLDFQHQCVAGDHMFVRSRADRVAALVAAALRRAGVESASG